MTVGYMVYFLPLAVLYYIVSEFYGDERAIPATVIAAVVWGMVLF